MDGQALGFEVVYHTKGISGGRVAHIRDTAGRLRRATVEEERLWLALEAARAKLALYEQALAEEGEEDSPARRTRKR